MIETGLTIFAGSSNLPLADEICEYLDVPRGDATTGRFPEQEVNVKTEVNPMFVCGLGPRSVSVMLYPSRRILSPNPWKSLRLRTSDNAVHYRLEPLRLRVGLAVDGAGGLD